MASQIRIKLKKYQNEITIGIVYTPINIVDKKIKIKLKKKKQKKWIKIFWIWENDEKSKKKYAKSLTDGISGYENLKISK